MTNKTNIPLVNDTFDIQIFWNILKKTKWIIALVFLLTIVLTVLYLRYTPNIYESSSVIQINSENSSTKILDVENPYAEDQLAQSVELLKSKKMVRKMLNALPLNVSYFNKGIFLSEELYKRSPIEITYKKIVEIKLTLPFIQNKLFKTGNISIQTAGGGYISIVNIDNPEEVYNEILLKMKQA
jgi:hypothetical protein